MNKLLFSILAFFLTLLLLVYFFQRQLIFFPEQDAPSPSNAGVPEMDIIQLHTADGLFLKAWYAPATQPDLPTILYCHGNAGHLGYRAMIVRSYLNKGYGVLLLTYRGFSGNPGTPTEKGLYQAPKKVIIIPRKGHNEIDEPRVVIDFLQNLAH